MASEIREYTITLSKAFKHALDTIQQLGWKIKRKDERNGIIIAETNVSIWSWGERIELQLSYIQDKVTLKITSESVYQILDWGKGKENLRTFLKIFERNQ